MADVDDLKLIKKYYGEAMAHYCSDTFPTILEHEGMLFQLISESFAYNKDLYYDIVVQDVELDFKSFIFTMYKEKTGEDAVKKSVVAEDPFELMERAGYTLYECHSEEDIQSFRHYYDRKGNGPTPVYVSGQYPEHHQGEELCTFNGGRLDTYDVFFAVKHGAENLDRKSFINPRRQDEYGTSVISIQFAKGDFNNISIKNRYNHTVANPDSTFSNDLENIIAGLTDAFAEKYGYNLKTQSHGFELEGYVLAANKFYKYNFECNNIYFCPNNIVIDNNNPIQFDKERYVAFDGCILDLVTSNESLDQSKPFYNFRSLKESLPEVIGPVKKVNISVDKNTKTRTITINDSTIIELNKNNDIIGFTNNEIEKIPNNFLNYAYYVEKIEINNVKEIGNDFCTHSRRVNSFSANSVEKIGNSCLSCAKSLERIILPNVKHIGHNFCFTNKFTRVLDAPNLVDAGELFMESAILDQEVNLQNVQKLGRGSLNCASVRTLSLPSLIKIGQGSFGYVGVEEFSAPLLRDIPEEFMVDAKKVRRVNTPLVAKVGYRAFNNAVSLEELYLPKAQSFGKAVFMRAMSLRKLVIPKDAKFEREEDKNRVPIVYIEDLGMGESNEKAKSI